MKSKFVSQHYCLVLCLALFVDPLVLQGQDQGFQLDDVIKAEVSGGVYEGKVFAIKNGGKYINVNFYDGKGNTLNRTIPASKATLVRRAPPKTKPNSSSDSTKMKSGSSPGNTSGNTKKNPTSGSANAPKKVIETGAENRLWTKRNGEPYFKGVLLDQLEGIGRFERIDGEVIELDLKELSIFDRILLNKLENKVSPNAFAIGKQPLEEERMVLGNEKGKFIAKNYPTSEFVTNDSKSIVFAGATEWEYQPDALPSYELPSSLRVPFDATVDRRSKTAFVASQLGDAAAFQPDLKQGKILVADLRKGAQFHSFEIQLPKVTLVDINSKFQILTVDDNRLDLWDGTTGDHLQGLEFKYKVSRAEFIDDSKFLATDQLGWTGVIDIESVQTLYSYKKPSNGKTSFSAGRKFFAIGTEYGIAIVRVADGKVVASIQAEKNIDSLAFSPSGEKLVGVRLKQVFVWDLTTGKLMDDFQPKYAGGDAQWIDEDFVLLRKSNLVSTKLRTQIWSFGNGSTGPGVARIPGFFWRYSSVDGPAAIVVQVPHEEIIKKLAEVRSDDSRLLEPGSTVRIQTDLPFAGEDRNKVLAHFKSEIEKRECSVGENADYVLHAYIVKGDRKTMVFGDYNPLSNRIEAAVSFIPQYCRTEILDSSGKKIWERVSVCEPHSLIILGRGETFESAVKDQCKPSPIDFTLGRVPKYKPIQINTQFGWLGTSGFYPYKR